MHPFAVKRSEPGLRKRGANLPLTSTPSNVWIGDISFGTPPQTLKGKLSLYLFDICLPLIYFTVQIDTGAA
jgi:hypothetical protein